MQDAQVGILPDLSSLTEAENPVRLNFGLGEFEDREEVDGMVNSGI